MLKTMIADAESDAAVAAFFERVTDHARKLDRREPILPKTEDTRIMELENCLVCDAPTKQALCDKCYNESYFDTVIVGTSKGWQSRRFRVHTRVKCKFEGCRCCLMFVRSNHTRSMTTLRFYCASCGIFRALVYKQTPVELSCLLPSDSVSKDAPEITSESTGEGVVCGISRSAQDSTGIPSAQPEPGLP